VWLLPSGIGNKSITWPLVTVLSSSVAVNVFTPDGGAKDGVVPSGPSTALNSSVSLVGWV
jgi:hypothetical protein